MVLALAFATAAGLQGWHAHRSQVIHQSVIDARADGMAMLSYLACYERQLRRSPLQISRRCRARAMTYTPRGAVQTPINRVAHRARLPPTPFTACGSWAPTSAV